MGSSSSSNKKRTFQGKQMAIELLSEDGEDLRFQTPFFAYESVDSFATGAWKLYHKN